MKRSVTVQIAGVRYALKTEEDDRWVKQVAAFVDGKIREVQKHTRTVDTQAVAVLTALQIAEELFNERRESGELRKKIRDKSQSLLDVLAREARYEPGAGGGEARPPAGDARARARRCDAEQRVALTVAAVERLLALPALAERRGARVAGYVAVGGELSPAGALAFVRDEGGTVALPRVSDTPPRLRFHAQEAETRLRHGTLRSDRAARDRAGDPRGRAGGDDRPGAGVRRRRAAASGSAAATTTA